MTWPVFTSRTTADPWVVSPSDAGFPEALLGHVLQVLVDGQGDGAAVLGGGGLVDPRRDGVATAADLHPPVTRDAGQLVVERLLDARETGALLADEAHDLPTDGAGRVEPHRVVLEQDAGEL